MKTVDKTDWVVGVVLAKQAQALPDIPFVQFADHEPYTFSAMDDSATRIANGLADFGVRHSARVLVMLPNSIAFLQAWLAVSRLGAVFVPMNTGLQRCVSRACHKQCCCSCHGDCLGFCAIPTGD